MCAGQTPLRDVRSVLRERVAAVVVGAIADWDGDGDNALDDDDDGDDDGTNGVGAVPGTGALNANAFVADETAGGDGSADGAGDRAGYGGGLGATMTMTTSTSE